LTAMFVGLVGRRNRMPGSAGGAAAGCACLSYMMEAADSRVAGSLD
jgi:hypothetical protein